jgi:outer membrane protein OmpA-like peptidoglycan-associated protein
MTVRYWLGLGLAASLLAAPALADDPSYNPDTLSAMPQLAQAPEFDADDLAAILTPLRTRGLTAGTGIDPGSPGSGVVPDLRIQFGFDSSELTPETQVQLDELAQAMKSDNLRDLRFQIGGHTDAAGSDRYNEWLSEQRALAVSSYLAEQHGIEPERVKAIGFGKRELARPDDPLSGVNRRVEVRTLQ